MMPDPGRARGRSPVLAVEPGNPRVRPCERLVAYSSKQYVAKIW
ncbi:hypothetical protein V1227_23555 [Lentzea sp. DG1S-22]|nr:hypothetical protein [Lentzea sp. DG1S-22]WVH78063.1 hypothetical protein V1227_23555 [Lentzea sp. DG1S-22]